MPLRQDENPVSRCGETEPGSEAGAERPGLQRTLGQRTRRILKGFIRRYLRGIQSRDFRELAGFHVMANNYAIFSYLLWRLMAKDWVEPEFLLDAFLQIWTFFWGDRSHSGYFRELGQAEQADFAALVAPYQADAVFLAALYQGEVWTRAGNRETQRLVLRDFWRGVLSSQAVEVTPDALERASLLAAQLNRYDPPLPSHLVKALASLAAFETRRTFLRALEASHHYTEGSASFEQATVSARRQPVTVLVLQAKSALSTMEDALAILGQWMSFEKLDYYRIATPDVDGTRRMLFFDVTKSDGVYWNRQAGQPPKAFVRVAPVLRDWETSLERLRKLAAQVDSKVAEIQSQASIA